MDFAWAFINAGLQSYTYLKGDYLTPRFLRHHLYGGGAPYRLTKDEIRLISASDPPYSVTDSQEIGEAINHVMKTRVSESISEKEIFYLATGRFGNNSVANYSILVKGDVMCDSKSKWKFRGKFKDRFDFDWKDWGERSLFGEFATRVGSVLTASGKDFDITSDWISLTQVPPEFSAK